MHYSNNTVSFAVMMFQNLFYVSLALLLFASCTDKKNKALIADEDFREFARINSPDHKKLLLNYGSHKGAFGYGIRGTAILNNADTSKNLVKYTLPNTITDFKWLGNDTVTAYFDVIPSIRDGKEVAVHDTVVNGVVVKILANDHIANNAEQIILRKEPSPDKKYEMVIYRYGKEPKASLLHLSVIPAKATLPKYGNYFIANAQSDYILNAHWDKANKLIFYTDDVGKDLIYYGLVKTRPAVEYQIVSDDDRYKGIKLWQGK